MVCPVENNVGHHLHLQGSAVVLCAVRTDLVYITTSQEADDTLLEALHGLVLAWVLDGRVNM
jgi:hypothetical protein